MFVPKSIPGNGALDHKLHEHDRSKARLFTPNWFVRVPGCDHHHYRQREADPGGIWSGAVAVPEATVAVAVPEATVAVAVPEATVAVAGPANTSLTTKSRLSYLLESVGRSVTWLLIKEI